MNKECTYCGSPYDLCREHVIANHYLRSGRRYRGDWIVPACRDCNSILGGELIFTIPGRAEFLSNAYKKRYKKLLRMPDWTQKELETVSDTLRNSILETLSFRDEVSQRLSKLDLVAGYPADYLRPENV